MAVLVLILVTALIRVITLALVPVLFLALALILFLVLVVVLVLFLILALVLALLAVLLGHTTRATVWDLNKPIRGSEHLTKVMFHNLLACFEDSGPWKLTQGVTLVSRNSCAGQGLTSF